MIFILKKKWFWNNFYKNSFCYKNMYTKKSDFFFCCLTNKSYFKKEYMWNSFLFSKWIYFFFIRYKKKLSFNYYFNFCYLKKEYSNFLKFFNLILKKVNYFSIYRLKLIGLGYRFRFITNYLYRIFCGYSTYIYFFTPKSIKVYSYGRVAKRLLFLSYNLNKLMSFISTLILIKYMSTYRYVGVIKPTKYVRFKTGKQR
jgi:hypothetical protein